MLRCRNMHEFFPDPVEIILESGMDFFVGRDRAGYPMAGGRVLQFGGECPTCCAWATKTRES